MWKLNFWLDIEPLTWPTFDGWTVQIWQQKQIFDRIFVEHKYDTLKTTFSIEYLLNSTLVSTTNAPHARFHITNHIHYNSCITFIIIYIIPHSKRAEKNITLLYSHQQNILIVACRSRTIYLSSRGQVSGVVPLHCAYNPTNHCSFLRICII